MLWQVLRSLFAGRQAREESPQTAEFWTSERVHTINIRITPQQWQMMQPLRTRSLQRLSAGDMPPPSSQPSTRPVLIVGAPATQPAHHVEGERQDPNFYGLEFAYVKADFECDGVSMQNVGFRQRGNSSYNWAANSYKRPFKVDFNRYVDGQKFLGLGAFYLNNNAYDPSFMRETLAYETFRELGVPAPRTCYGLVYLTIEGRLNREYLGLYTLLEEIDSKDFLKHHFGSAKGMLMKPWSIRGLPYFGEEWRFYESRYNVRRGLSAEALAARLTSSSSSTTPMMKRSAGRSPLISTLMGSCACWRGM